MSNMSLSSSAFTARHHIIWADEITALAALHGFVPPSLPGPGYAPPTLKQAMIIIALRRMWQDLATPPFWVILFHAEGIRVHARRRFSKLVKLDARRPRFT